MALLSTIAFERTGFEEPVIVSGVVNTLKLELLFLKMPGLNTENIMKTDKKNTIKAVIKAVGGFRKASVSSALSGHAFKNPSS